MLNLPLMSKWLDETSVAFSRRDGHLLNLDRALAVCLSVASLDNAKLLDRELKSWKRENPRWEASPRNGRGAITRLTKSMLDYVDPQLNQRPFLWCPSFDVEMRRCAGHMKKHLNLHEGVFEGRDAALHQFGSRAKLYILCHGHENIPVFTCDNKEWSADSLADMLVAAGINPQIKQIEMLVCHAGESVNTIENASDLLMLQYERRAAKAAKASNEVVEALSDQMEALQRKIRPQPYEHALGIGTKTHFLMEQQGRWLLPLAAQLANALKMRHLTNFTLISYKAEVVQNPEAKKFVNTSTNPPTVVKETPAGIKLALPYSIVQGHPDLQKLHQLTSGSHSQFVLASEYPEFIATWR